MTLEIRSDVLSSNRIRVLIEELDMETLNHAEWPSDLHLVEYELDGTTYAAGVRAHSKVDIFDCFWTTSNLSEAKWSPSALALEPSSPSFGQENDTRRLRPPFSL